MNATHDPQRRSWVESAHNSEFPIQNLPFGVFKRRGPHTYAQAGVAIGNQIVDLAACVEQQLFTGAAAEAAQACCASTLNAFLSLGQPAWSALRAALSDLLRSDGPFAERADQLAAQILVPMSAVDMQLPMTIGDYTDFYASIHHATNIGSMFRPDNPLLPNYKYIPIGYHGRASSVVISGTPVRRPVGQTKGPQEEVPSVQPSRLLDYEMEVGFVVGPGNVHGEPIALAEAEAHIFGMCLVNDWSARDMQAWEYQPLGPFLAKSFATTISPWIVTLEALEPFRCAAFERAKDDPQPLPYLADQTNQRQGGVDLQVEVWLLTKSMREQGREPTRLSSGNFCEMYWTIGQMLTHHASNGCPLLPGDLMASGTISGPIADSRGSLIELTMRGQEPLQLPAGEERRFLEDGDEVILRGYCKAEGAVAIGFGECRGTITAAPQTHT